MKRLFRIVTASAIIGSLCGCGLTSESKEGSHGLPFGLSKFHWGMSADEAAPLYTGLSGKVQQEFGFLPPSSGTSLGPYIWNGCSLLLEFQFADEGLSEVNIGGIWSTACQDNVGGELMRHFGEAVKNYNANGFETLEWGNNLETKIVYRTNFNILELRTTAVTHMTVRPPTLPRVF
jgi:hypothetical protein